MPVTYSISELSEQFDVTPRTIRFYEDKGLISPIRQGTRRVYRDRDRVRLRLIMRAKRIGFSLSEIQETLSLYDSTSGEVGQLRYVLDIIARRRSVLNQQLEDIRLVLDDISQVERQVRDKLRLNGDST